MSSDGDRSEFLVISRGQWSPKLSRDEIQAAIDEFYVWHDRLVGEGRMRPGSRLADTGRTVHGNGLVTDGPYGETKEVIGGFWTILARDLDEAARIGAQNPCLRCGLFFELRPLESLKASAFAVTTETPRGRRDGGA
ncbi:MAG: YciI family protein [Candidatus Binatia bacterium]